MPSGSHGGGGGGHSSGGHSGGHSGGFSSGRSYTGNHSSRLNYRRNIHYHHSHVYYGSGGGSTRASKEGLLFVFSIIGVFFAIAFGLSLKEPKTTINTIKSDYERYTAMVERATSDSTYSTEALVLDSFKAYGDKYYIYYCIPFNDGAMDKVKENVTYSYMTSSYWTESENDYLIGYTYSLYTAQEGLEMVDKKIMVALDCKNTAISKNTDSIPMDYTSFALEDDGQYIECKKELLIKSVVTALFALCGIVSITLLVITLVKNKMDNATVNDDDDYYQSSSSEAKPTTYECRYCGFVMDDSESRCPQCGAAKQ